MLNFPPWKKFLILGVVLIGVLGAMPNAFLEETVTSDDWPGFLPSSQINLGLDLQGGSHMLLEIDMDSVISDRLDVLEDDIRRVLFNDNQIRFTDRRRTEQAVSFALRDDANRDVALTALRGLAQPIVNNLFPTGANDIEVDDLGDGRISVGLTDAGLAQRKASALSQSIEIIRRRVDELGTREPTIQAQGDSRVLVQVPGIDDPRRLEELIGKTAKLTFHDVDTTSNLQSGRVPPGTLLLPMADEAGGQILVKRRALISGENLVDASQCFDQQGLAAVCFRFDAQGAQIFGAHTQKNIGRQFAISLDGEVITAPRIISAILGGNGQITGNFNVQTATDLAILLRAGALPAELTIVEQRSVGPGLGKDSVEAGKNAALIGFVGVMIYMALSYGMFGMAANVALILNLFLIAGGLSYFGATLTLPGIAGIVLTIGMAVDANVLVFERVREEVRVGKSPFAALETGYSSALSTILDANITTFIAAFLLFAFGSGPVKGFAVTLAIGILTSMFTAIMVTRLMLATWIKRRKPSELPI